MLEQNIFLLRAPFLLCVFLMMAYLVGGNETKILLQSHFDQPPDTQWKVLSGNWYYQDGCYLETTDGLVTYWSVAGEDFWTDYSITVEMKALDSGGSLFLAGRWQDENNHYEMEYQGRGDCLQINRVLFGQRQILVRKKGVLDIGGGVNPFGRFRFTLRGPLLSVAINDQDVMQIVDRTFVRGKIALGEKERRGVWKSVSVEEKNPPGPEEIAFSSPELELASPVTSFLRGKIENLRFRLVNTTAHVLPEMKICLSLSGLLEMQKESKNLASGEEFVINFPLDTRKWKSGTYWLKAEMLQGQVITFQRFWPIIIAPVPAFQRLEVLNWGGLMPGIEKHGFTSFWISPVINPVYARQDLDIPVDASDKETIELTFQEYNQGLGRGLVSGLQVNNIWARNLRTRIDFSGVSLEGRKMGNNPHHPAFREWAKAWMEAVMKTFAGFDGLKTVNLNSEWDREFDYSDQTLALYQKDFGCLPPRFCFPVDRKNADKKFLPVNGVIEDDNPYYQYLLWWWKKGQGLVPFNEDMARIVKKYRPDILTISEPVLRCPFLYGKAKGCDIAQHWSYAWPGPRSLLFYIDSLVATKKYTGQMISHDVQILWKKGWVGPFDMTPSPDIIRESMWINLSRAMDCLFFWGTHLAIGEEKDSRQTTHPQVYEELASFSEKVTRPFGPLVKRLKNSDKQVAFLVSTASQLFVDGWRWAPEIHSMNFYDALQAANIPTDVIYEDDVRQDVLEKRKYKAVILSYCQTLPRSVYSKLVTFARKGGLVLADAYLVADIPGVKKLPWANFDFVSQLNYSNVSSGKTDVETVRRKLDEIVARLKDLFQGVYQPEISLKTSSVLYNVLEGKAMKLFVLVNDRRQAGEWADRFKTIEETGVPQEFEVSFRLKKPGSVVYDLLEHQMVSGKKKGSWLTFTCNLGPCEGKYFAEYAQPISCVVLKTSKVRKKGDPVNLSVEVRGTSGEPLEGYQPLKINIFDGSGEMTEYSDYYCAEDGRFSLTFSPGLNEPAGFWKIEVRELAGGHQARLYVEIPASRNFSSPQRIDENTGQNWDRD